MKHQIRRIRLVIAALIACLAVGAAGALAEGGAENNAGSLLAGVGEDGAYILYGAIYADMARGTPSGGLALYQADASLSGGLTIVLHDTPSDWTSWRVEAAGILPDLGQEPLEEVVISRDAVGDALPAHSFTAEEIGKALRELTPKIDGSFVVDRLEYLRKGGRCSTAAALGANLLAIKPCIEVRDGNMLVAKKYRGKYDHVLREYVHERLADDNTLRLHRIMVTHTPVPDGIVDLVKEEIRACQPFAEILETEALGTIACHCGPHTLGILYIHK